MTKHGEITEWCRLLERVCAPGQGGCVLYGGFLFSDPATPSKPADKQRKTKQRSDNPLGER